MIRLLIFFCCLFVFYLSLTTTKDFNTYCTDYIIDAQKTDNVQLAEQRLSKAISYLELEDKTKGFTSRSSNDKKYDIGLFYQKLVDSKRMFALASETDNLQIHTQAFAVFRDSMFTKNKRNEYEPVIPENIELYPHINEWNIARISSIVIMIMITISVLVQWSAAGVVGEMLENISDIAFDLND